MDGVAAAPPRCASLAIGAIAILLAALTFTYSQTSFVALIAGVGLLVWFRFGMRGLAWRSARGAASLRSVPLR